MTSEIRFFVPGIPRPGGSKKAIVRGGRAIITEARDFTAAWRDRVAAVAVEHCKDDLLKGPLAVSMLFVFARPEGHMGTGKNAGKPKPSARSHPTGKPDLTKLVRSAEDALKGIVWGDDSQVVQQSNRKDYGPKPGVWIVVRRIESPKGA